MKINDIELLAPAGDMGKLGVALRYGADAVYLAGARFGLRATAGNFTNAELKKAVKIVHDAGARVYVTVNVFARNDMFGEIIKYAKYLEQIGVDAVIVSDLGVLNAIKANTTLEIHISTQANVLNKYTAEHYVNGGAKRIILARECSIKEIKEIANHLRGRAEIEVFVHGAMCVSYSGRCMLSDYMVGGARSSNRGACVQPCRFKYALVEEKRPGEYHEITEDANGTYIMNSKDLCLIEHLDELRRVGVKSFKIEGRTKSEYYLANTVNAYRRVMDGEVFDRIQEVEKSSHRKYTTGFVFAETGRQNTANATPTATHEFVARVIARSGTTKQSLNGLDSSARNFIIEQRNTFSIGDTLEVLSPTKNHNKSFVVGNIWNSVGENITTARRVQEVVTVDCPFELCEGDFLRRRQTQTEIH